MNRRPHFLPTALLIFALLAAACGSDGGSPAATESAPNPATTTKDEAAFGESFTGLTGIPIGDDQAMQTYMDDLEREVEENAATCMRAEGFSYTPVHSGQLAEGGTFAVGDREFAENHGFGLVANFQVNPQQSNPNVDHVATLTQGEAEAYITALLGDEIIDRFGGVVDAENIPELITTSPLDMEQGLSGCKGEAFEESFNFIGVLFAFEDQIGAIVDAVDAESGVVEAERTWSRCMSGDGFDVDTEDELRETILNQIFEIVDSPDSWSGGTGMRGASVNNDRITITGDGDLTAEAQAAVDELQADEIAAAVASWDCGEDLRAAIAQANIEIEQRIVEQHGAEISAMMEGA